MTRTMLPVGRFPRTLMEFETEWPRWMTRMFEEGVLPEPVKFLPEVNMVETDKGIEVTVELPGLKPEQVQLEVRENALWITGEKKEEKEEKGKTFHRIERRTGAFRRAIPLPTEVEEGRAEAMFENGVLKVVLPKAAAVMPKAIPIKG